MTDFNFYSETYCGSLIPADAWDAVCRDAEAQMNRHERIYHVSYPQTGSRNKAVCAMAEALYAFAQLQAAGGAGRTIRRIVIRTCILPAVNIVSATNSDAMLRLEQFSPLLCCLPMIAYGLGYPQGVRIRTQVQADIAAGKRKARKQANKERKQRTAQHGPEQPK